MTDRHFNMTDKRFAVIDIGSNSIRYMDESSAGKLTVTTRLGSFLAETGRLDEARMAHSIRVIAAMANNARHAGFTPVAYATSAVRDCSNQQEFLERVLAASGVKVDVLSGEREAEYAFCAAVNGKGGLIDIGGASMQFVTADFRRSYPVGCVRGRDIAQGRTGSSSCDENYPAQRDALCEYIDSLFVGEGTLPDAETMRPTVGVGGTITTLGALVKDLAAYDKSHVHGTVLERERLEELIVLLSKMGEKRREHPLLRVRHDVILYGAAILAKAMDTLFIERLTVSCRDGLEGYLDAAVRGEVGL